MSKKFYDTCSLLIAGEEAFSEPFAVSSITFKELERIKTAANKDAQVKYSARLLLHLFEEYPEKYQIVVHKLHNEDILKTIDIEINDDAKILSDAWSISDKDLVFVTNDLALKHLAYQLFNKDMVTSVEEDPDTYIGYKEIITDSTLLETFYQDSRQNIFNLLIGEYLILRNENKEVIDLRVWTGKDHEFLNSGSLNSKWFGKIKPHDIYQKLLIDSLTRNKITMIKGPAGSGKTILSLAYLMSCIERGKLDKIVVFCNTIATANSAKLGFYPGTRNDKLLDSQLGNLLSSKFGSREGVEQLINSDKLVLLPMSDIRGFDTTGMKAGIYISEAQNLDRTLMKLALQRIGEDCICIIDGDIKSQVDDVHFEGNNNGMRRASKIFRNHDIYGEITLNTIYRSEIGRIAEMI